MSVRPVDPRSSTPVQTPAVSQQPARPAAPAAPAAQAPASSSEFAAPAAQSNALAGASSGHVPLKSMSPSSVAVTPRRIALDSPEAKKAIDIAVQSQSIGIAGPNVTGNSFKARSVDVDDFGLTHVRMDRTFKGLKVFGEQVVTSLDRDGKVVSNLGNTAEPQIPWDAAAPGAVSSQAALATAQKDFGAKPEKLSQEEVLVKNAAGEYVRAHHISLTNLTEGEPREQHYLVDANTGKVMDSWNQIDPFIKQEDIDRAQKAGLLAETPAEPVTVTASATPNAPIEDMGTTTSTVSVDADLDLSQVKLNLDVAHTWKGDLKVTVTSPSGKEYVVSNRQGGSTDDIKGEFDLTEAFKGESTKGEWKVTVQDMARRDVGTLNSWSLSLTGKDKTPPVDKKDDTSMYSGKVEVGATQQADGSYKLEDGNRGKGVVTKDAQNKSNRTGAVDISDGNNVWGEVTDSPRNAAAVDAAYGGQMTYDFYKNVLGRDSIDGKGEALVSNVHIRTNYVNAYWDGQQMNYGDGDGKNATALTSLDIAGHEITHGLTERTAGLIYRGESGGINEAMSDILGKGVEWYAAQQNPDVKFTWGVGERVWTPGKEGDALRYMDDPTKDKYSVDNYKNYPKQTEVHGSSGIANNAFFLLAQGGTNRTSGIEVKDAIGMDNALKIFGRALTTYMTPSTTFAQARQATIQAATDMFGADSAEVAKVKESWTAVGVN